MILSETLGAGDLAEDLTHLLNCFLCDRILINVSDPPDFQLDTALSEYRIV